jgi:hypothetical protein
MAVENAVENAPTKVVKRVMIPSAHAWMVLRMWHSAYRLLH